jgi:hypothetical protein
MPACDLRAAASAMLWLPRDPLARRPHFFATRRGTPPQVLWLRCGNMPNARLWTILTRALPYAIELLRQGEPVVEISLAEGERRGRPRRSTRPRP